MQSKALAVLVLLAVVPALAIQWSNAYTDATDSLFFPGVEVTIRFWAASDLRINTNGVTDQTTIMVNIGSWTSDPVPPSTTTDYCDGCALAPPKTSKIQITDTKGTELFSFTQSIPAYSFCTLVVSGTTLKGITASIDFDPPRWYQAYFWTGTGAGAWHAETMWHLPQTGDIAVDLYLPLPSPNNLRGYTAGQPVFMNVSVSDTKDGDFPDTMVYHGPGLTPVNTQYFTLAPFLYRVAIINNQNLLWTGSQLQLTGAALDTDSSYACVFNNTRTGLVAMSGSSQPSSSTTYQCTLPDAIANAALPGDSIELINVTCTATADPQNNGYLPISSPTQTNPKFRFTQPNFPPADNGGGGLNGGQIFGIILAVFVGVGVLGYGGFRLYKHYGSSYGYMEQTDSTGKPQQIQYNPSSYQSSADSSKPFQSSDNNL